MKDRLNLFFFQLNSIEPFGSDPGMVIAEVWEEGTEIPQVRIFTPASKVPRRAFTHPDEYFQRVEFVPDATRPMGERRRVTITRRLAKVAALEGTTRITRIPS